MSYFHFGFVFMVFNATFNNISVISWRLYVKINLNVLLKICERKTIYLPSQNIKQILKFKNIKIKIVLISTSLQ